MGNVQALTERRNELLYMLVMQTKALDDLKDRKQQAEANLIATNGALQEVEHWLQKLMVQSPSEVNLGVPTVEYPLNLSKAA